MENDFSKSNFELIGEFTWCFAKLELHLCKFLCAYNKQTVEIDGVLSFVIAKKFDVIKKVKKLDNIINFNLSSGSVQNIADVKEVWKAIYPLIVEVTEARHHLIHGLGASNIDNENVATLLAGDNMNLTERYLEREISEF